ncbi:hypothetical protein M231_06103 [Tremella mesenterica]|uniref:Uncharacterized protein n=1 Tax=Tremella mesenterica TaxID=5217 RepID=A0A4V1M3F0_TREME|nr:uncharacterized protein TREMEDRAFT_65087 [Tremella mesenterica DSM 1558]EIW66694.1 hypothetical protein TREMEDRAFT_65087 [Tremella mesenterica DSM 1558]RXK36640.1 hypothetical protein M231_06103 [Tremella mesenterica]
MPTPRSIEETIELFLLVPDATEATLRLRTLHDTTAIMIPPWNSLCRKDPPVTRTTTAAWLMLCGLLAEKHVQHKRLSGILVSGISDDHLAQVIKYNSSLSKLSLHGDPQRNGPLSIWTKWLNTIFSKVGEGKTLPTEMLKQLWTPLQALCDTGLERIRQHPILSSHFENAFMLMGTSSRHSGVYLEILYNQREGILQTEFPVETETVSD